MVITALSAYKGETLEIELDGAQKVYVNRFTAERFGVEKGEEISAEQLSELQSADTLRKAKKRALYLLGERAYCAGELYKKLEKSYGAEISESAVKYVSGLGYINDEEYADNYARALVLSKHRGISRARREMLLKGLSRELVESALSRFSQEKLDEELLFVIRRKYSEKLGCGDDRRRTTAALVRRGYDIGSIKRCIEAVINEKQEFEEE